MEGLRFRSPTVRNSTFVQVLLVPGIRVRRCIVEGIAVIFPRDEVVVKISRAVNDRLQARKLNFILLVQVSDELISIGADREAKGLQLLGVQIGEAVQAFQEQRGIGYGLGPVVLGIQIAEQLAPLENAHVDEVAIESPPELSRRRATGAAFHAMWCGAFRRTCRQRMPVRRKRVLRFTGT